MKSNTKEKENGPIASGRRAFLSLLPIGVFGAIAVSLGFASKRVLEPQDIAKPAEGWKTVGEVAEFSGTDPVTKTITVESQTGWSKTVEDMTVFVLPEDDHKVLSSVCPHEGCPILWDSDSKNFLCPCHDSFFSSKGKRLTGPAKDEMISIKSVVKNGKLQIKV